MNPCRKLRSRLLAVAAMLTLGAIMQAAAPVRPAAEPAGVPLEPRTVYLTFDDGPSRNTEAILSVLREEEVPATFFVTLAEREDYSDAYAALCESGSRWRCTALFTTMTGSMKAPGPTGRISGAGSGAAGAGHSL